MKETVINIIRNACALNEEVSENSELNTLSIDSLSFVNAIVELEEAFGISFDIDELNVAQWHTVTDIIHSMEERIHA